MKRFYVRCFILILLVLGNSVILKGGPLPEVPSNPILANNFFVESPESTPNNPIYLYRIPHGFVVFEKGRVTYQFIKSINLKPDALLPEGYSIPDSFKIINYCALFKGVLNDHNLSGLAPNGGVTNYLKGSTNQSKLNNANFNEVLYKNLYPGIDLKYYSKDGELKYDFIVHPGAEIENIKVVFEGLPQLKLTNTNEYSGGGKDFSFVDRMPESFQTINKQKFLVDVVYREHNENEITFEAGNYNKDYDLVIDPALVFSTFVGGNDDDYEYTGGMSKDNSGNIYVTGRTLSSNFPVTPGVVQASYGGGLDCFVFKLDPTGSSLLYSTFVGGNNVDAGYTTSVDPITSEVVVAGTTGSNNFPVTPGAYQTVYGGGVYDGFVFKLNSSGSAFVFSSLFGNNANDLFASVAVDNTGTIWAVGQTNNTFIITPGAYQSTYGGGPWDVIIVKISSNGGSLLASTMYGGSGDDHSHSIKVDLSGNVYIAGFTSGNLPLTAGTYDNTFNGGGLDTYVAKFDNTLSNLIFATYVGSNGADWMWNSMEIDASGNTYITGYTSGNNWPVSIGAFQSINNGGNFDAFLYKLNSTGTALSFCTYFGESGDDQGWGIVLDGLQPCITGMFGTSLPIVSCTYDSTYNFGNDAFIAKFDVGGQNLLYSTYIGGSSDDQGYNILKDGSDYLIAGASYSNNFPTTLGSSDPTFNGTRDVFVLRMSENSSTVPSTAAFTSPLSACVGQLLSFTNNSLNGSGYLWSFGDGGTSSILNPTHTYLIADTFDVQLIVIGSGCYLNDTISRTVIIYPQPVASFTYQASCTGSVNFFNTAVNTTANWSFNNLGTANGDTVNFQFNTSGSGIPITLIVQNANGCADTIIQNITIPAVTIAAFTLPDSLCGLAISPLNTSTGTLYNWSFGDNTNSTLGSPTHTYATAGTYTVTLIVDTAACADTLTTQVTLINEPQAVCTFTTDCNLGVSINNQSSNATGYFWNWGNSFTASGLQTNYTYASSGPYQITLVANNAGFCFDTLIQNINIPLNAIAAFSLPDSICGLTITPQNSSIGSLFHWNFGDSNTSSLTAPSHTYSTSGTYTITLIADTTVCADTLTQQVTLIDNPQATCTFTSDCFLGISLNNLSTNATTYSWDWGDTNSATGVQSNYTYATAGNYLVTLVVGNAGFCYDTLQQNVTVQETPVTNFTYPSPLCVGNVQFTANGTVASTYAWTFGDGGISSVASPMHNYLNAGLFTVQMIASNGVCADTNTVQIQIQPNPVAALSDSSGCDLLHYFQPVGLSPGGNSYQWYFGDGDSSILSSDQHLFASAGVYNVTLIVTSPQGCSDTTISPVNVREKAVAIFTPQVPACGLLVVFSNASTNSSSSAWDFGDGSTSLLSQPSYTYISGGNYTVVLIADTGICSDSASANFTLNENPVADFTFNGGCSDTLLFQNLSTGATGYFWTFGDGDSSASTDPVHIYNAAGNYPVILVASSGAGCKDTISQLLTVNTIPAPVIVAVVDSCKQRVYFTTSVDSLTPVTWIFGDGTTSFGPSVTHEYSDTGIYTVTLILEPNTPCADSAYASITIVPGESTPVFIPNCFTPNNDLINDRFSFGRVASCAIYHLQIYNRWGQKIVDTYDVERGWDGTFNGQDSPEGVYVFLVTGSVEVQGFVTLLR